MTTRFLGLVATMTLSACASTGGNGVHDPLANGLGADIDITAGSSWSINDGVLSPLANESMAFAYTTQTYADFDLTLEFYPVGQANSGVFVRCEDPAAIAPTVCYEFNIWDAHTNADFKTGSIVRISPPQQSVDTEDKWNSMRLRLDGGRLQVWVNDVMTNDVIDDKFRKGHIAFQYGGNNSMVRFRNIRIQQLP